MIEVRQLTKRYGSTVAVDALTFDVRPRMVTGFRGPNGSGKSTTLRLILGLDAPHSGYSKIGGRSYRGLGYLGHLRDEVAGDQHLVVIGQGRLLADTSAKEFGSRAASVEEAFLDLTGASAEYRASWS